MTWEEIKKELFKANGLESQIRVLNLILLKIGKKNKPRQWFSCYFCLSKYEASELIQSKDGYICSTCHLKNLKEKYEISGSGEQAKE